MAHALTWDGREFVTIPRDEAIALAQAGSASVYDAILPGAWVVMKDGEQVKNLLAASDYDASKPKPKRKTTKKKVAKRKKETTDEITEETVAPTPEAGDEEQDAASDAD